MKKTLFTALALVAVFASCTRVTVESPSEEVLFNAVRHSAATRTTDYIVGYKDIPFGSYAWYKAVKPEDNRLFMDNQAIGYNEQKKAWTAVDEVYAWPKFGSIDFICYSPHTVDGVAAPKPVIAESSISYDTPWNVTAHPGVDVMYSDKVVGMTGNVDTDYYGYNSVPVLFHHALARLAFQVRAGSLAMVAETGDVTRWEVEVDSISVNGFLTTGTLDLNLAEDGKWTKPLSNVWTPTDARADYKMVTAGSGILTAEPRPIGHSFLVLPQTLDTQTLSVYITIRTYRDDKDGRGERLVFSERGIKRTAPFKMDIPGALDAWGINQYITYIITLNPVGRLEPIIFAPATVDWEMITVPTEIIL